MDSRAFFIAAVSLPLLLSGPVQAQRGSEQGKPIVADSVSGKAAIRALEAEMQKGVLNGDLQTLRRLWAPSFMVNAPRNVVVPNRNAVLDVFRKGIPDYTTFDPQIEKLRIQNGLAVVMGRETVEPVGDAPHAGKTVHRRYTHVWKEEGDRWRLHARHAHIVSVD